MPAPPISEEAKRKLEEMRAKAAEARAKAIGTFPFERVEVPGESALAQWEELKSAGRGFPIVLGNEDTIADLASPLHEMYPGKRDLSDILLVASQIRHPGDLIAYRAQSEAKAREHLQKFYESNPNARLPEMIVGDAQGVRHKLTREETLTALLQERKEPKVGEWPTAVEPAPGLSVAVDMRTGRPLDKTQIALIPTDDWTTIPAHLRWGGWNDCPAPEYHVAALRSWRDRYGAELVGLNRDTMNLRVVRAPHARAEAMDLAHEQYAYCSDIVDQGVGTMSALAATLMASSWWFFWWD